LILVTSLNRAGIETALVNYAREMSKGGLLKVGGGGAIELDFLVNRSEISAYESELEQLGCNIYRMGPMYPWRFGAYKKEFATFLKAHSGGDVGLGKYDIIHSHLEERSFFPLQIAADLKYPARLFAQSHSAHTMPWFQPKSIFRRYFRRGVRRLVNSGVVEPVAVSQIAASWLFGASSRIVTIVPNPVRLEGLAFDEDVRQLMRKKTGLGERELVLGTVGRLTYEKNHGLILEICAYLREKSPKTNVRVLIVGEGELRESLERQAKSLGIFDVLQIVEGVSNPYDYLQVMDIFMFPSRFEGLGIAAIEAQANGLQVLASDQVPAEVNLSGRVEFFPISHPNLSDCAHQWGDRIIELIESNELVRDEQAYDKVASSKYASPVATNDLLMLYQAPRHPEGAQRISGPALPSTRRRP
jgi:glycosyltransferase involved in cell wall biosynthesis